MTNSYKLAERINSKVNASVTYKTDLEQYDTPDYWVEANHVSFLYLWQHCHVLFQRGRFLLLQLLDTHSQLFRRHIKPNLSRFEIILVQFATDKINTEVVGCYGT